MVEAMAPWPLGLVEPYGHGYTTMTRKTLEELTWHKEN